MPTLREQAAARRRRSEADAHESFVEGLLPLLKPCTLIGFALLLTQLHGPPDSDHGSHLLHDGARGDLLDASPSHAERHRSATNRSTCTVASANRSLACRAALDETRELVAGADPDPLGHESNGSLPCPGLQAAMGARTVPPGVADRGAVHGRSWTVACGLPPVAAVQPRVYVHRFMDGAHRELLRAPAVARFVVIPVRGDRIALLVAAHENELRAASVLDAWQGGKLFRRRAAGQEAGEGRHRPLRGLHIAGRGECLGKACRIARPLQDQRQ